MKDVVTKIIDQMWIDAFNHVRNDDSPKSLHFFLHSYLNSQDINLKMEWAVIMVNESYGVTWAGAWTERCMNHPEISDKLLPEIEKKTEQSVSDFIYEHYMDRKRFIDNRRNKK